MYQPAEHWSRQNSVYAKIVSYNPLDIAILIASDNLVALDELFDPLA